MFNEQDSNSQSRFSTAVEKWISALDREHSLLEAVWDKITRLTTYTQTLVKRHPKTSLALVSVGILSLLSVIAYIKDDTQWGIPPYRSRLALGAGEDGRDGVIISVPKLPLESISLPEVGADKKVEATDTSGWKLLPGPGFSLRYPNEPGWRGIGNRIILGPDGNEDVKIEASAKALDGKSFEKFMEEQDATYKQNFPGLFTLQTVNFPGWEDAGLQGKVFSREATLRSGGERYAVKHYIAYINQMAYQVLVSQKMSQLSQTGPKVNGIVDSFHVAGTSTGLSQPSGKQEK